MKILCKNLAETESVAKDFVKKILAKKRKTALVVGLQGDLGSGKTTFVQFVAKNLGIKEIITSPTFVILKNYTLNANPYNLLVHIDGYRLESGMEIEKLGWQEIIKNPKNLVLIEWPERVAEVLPKDIWTINFKFVDENIREIES
jgi:tRNA threonylcarbamoyladenosine biosynthesis protein TsaE